MAGRTSGWTTTRTEETPGTPGGRPDPAARGAEAILDAFDRYRRTFRRLTRGARRRFEQRDWHGVQHDALARLELYGHTVDETTRAVRRLLGPRVQDPATWKAMRAGYARRIVGRDDFELVETFFNSITRRIFATVGVNPEIEFVERDFDHRPHDESRPPYRTWPWRGDARTMVRTVLRSLRFRAPWADLERDATLGGDVLAAHAAVAEGRIDFVDVIRPIFFRNKGAYVVGRLRGGGVTVPFVLPLLHPAQGIELDAVLTDPNDVSSVFSFTRSYFHVDLDLPHEAVDFLRSILPLKRVDELYTYLGFNKHGKTELYRELLRYLRRSNDRFVAAPGERGLVMIVFTLPGFDVVFKVIRDRPHPPKTTTRADVLDHYRFVFRHDRVGRLVDAQEFEHLAFDRARFDPGLLAELLDEAPQQVELRGDTVIIHHLYTERRVTPLDVYLRGAPPEPARRAVLDWGRCLKELAAANIFPGDLLMKNFGVTRQGRVVFYDYDELALLTGLRFRRKPEARDPDQEMEAEPWYFVGQNDVFPEEFRTFLGLDGEFRQAFEEAHGDLFDPAFWARTQERLRDGEMLDVYPYGEARRFAHPLAGV